MAKIFTTLNKEIDRRENKHDGLNYCEKSLCLRQWKEPINLWNKKMWVPLWTPTMVRVTRFERATSSSRTTRSTSWATPGFDVFIHFLLWSPMWSNPLFERFCDMVKVRNVQCFQGVWGFLRVGSMAGRYKHPKLARYHLRYASISKKLLNFVVVSYVVSPEFWPFFRSWWSAKRLVFSRGFGIFAVTWLNKRPQVPELRFLRFLTIKLYI